MPHHRAGRRGTLRRAVAALIVAVAMSQGLPFSPQPIFVPAGGSACWFEPLDLCNPAGAFSPRNAEMPLLPPAAPEPGIRGRAGAVPPAVRTPLPDGFPPAVYRPPRRLS